MFQLTRKESENLIFQNGRSSWGGTRKLPYVFTEQGVAMLSGILASDRAIIVNIEIMRSFIQMRQMLIDNSELRQAIEEIKRTTSSHAQKIDAVFKCLDSLLERKKVNEEQESRKLIGFKASKRKR
jgi:hypothetical protein